LESWLGKEQCGASPDMDPPFQRAHVWTKQQQIAFVEFVLAGGVGSNTIRWNCAGWMGSFKGPFVLVDGKQRLTAVLRFLRNEIGVFGGHYLREYDKLRCVQHDFVMMINSLDTTKEVLEWYLQINAGGVIHTDEELNKVRGMLESLK